MDKVKREKLEAAGWTVGTEKEFLSLSDEEAAYVEMKVALAAFLRKHRIDQHLSQVMVANRLKSSQSRVAKMEVGDKSVSVDLLLRSIFRLGGTREMVAAAICPCPDGSARKTLRSTPKKRAE